MVHRRLASMSAILAIFAVSACGRKESEPESDSVATEESNSSAAIVLPESKLDREELVLAALRALSATALGHDDAKAQEGLKGREFELRMRFGCPGVPASPARGWTYDEKDNVLRAHINADLSAEEVPASDLLLKGYEGVAGFTVDRPLLLTSGCPVAQFAAMPPVEPVIAVAQLFTSEDSRIQRPERSYEITKKVDAIARLTAGLDLVLSGRLAELSDGRTIHCAAADGPPTCLIAVKFDRVAIENPTDGSVLGEWSHW